MIAFADVTGDSFLLARRGAAATEAELVVFLGVYFMAEAADVLRAPHQTVVLPDLGAGCHLAECADIFTVRDAWAQMTAALPGQARDPAHLHELGRRPEGVRGRARRRGLHLGQRREGVPLGAVARATRCSSSPTSTSGATRPAAWAWPPDEPLVWNPRKAELGGLSQDALADAAVILWKGFCNVHTASTCARSRRRAPPTPDVRVIVHPECPRPGGGGGRRGRQHRVHHPPLRGAAGRRVGRDRHRLEPGQPAAAAAPGQADLLPQGGHLPVRDDEPHRPAEAHLVPRVAGRRRDGEPIAVDEEMAPLGPASRSTGCSPWRDDRAELVAAALAEDLGERGDITSTLLVLPAELQATARVGRARPGVLAGRAAGEEVLPPDRHRRASGSPRTARACAPGTVVAELSGPARAVLTAERTLLNLLCRLSGVATLTAAYVEACAPGGRARHAQDHARACARWRRPPSRPAAARTTGWACTTGCW